MKGTSLALFAATMLALNGCTRLKVLDADDVGLIEHRTSRPPSASFSAWRTLSDARGNEAFDGDVLTELHLLRDGREELVWRGVGTTWELELIEGEYRLRILEIYADGGSHRPTGDEELSFVVARDQHVDLRLIVEQIPWGAVIAGAAAAALVITAVVGASQRRPPRPPPMPVRPRPMVHSSVVIVVGPPRIWVPLGLWGSIDPYEVGLHPGGPSVERVSVPGSDRPEGQARIVFSAPLDPFTVAPDAVHVIGPTGRVPASVYWDEESLSVVWTPLRPLAPGAYELRAAARMLQDASGRPIDRSVRLPFTIGASATPSLDLLAP